MNTFLDILKSLGLIIGPLGVIYGVYQKIRAEKVIAQAQARGDAPYLKLSQIILKGTRERDDRWGTENGEKTELKFEENGLLGPDNNVPKGYPLDWPIELVCRNIGKSARSVNLKIKPRGLLIVTPVLDEIAAGESALSIHIAYAPKLYPNVQKFGFDFETDTGRVGYQEYEFDRYRWEVKRVNVK